MRTATFYSKLTIAKNETGEYLSTAAKQDILQSLRELLPEKQVVESGDDLVYFAANAACVGLVNLNGIGILPQAAIDSLAGYINKPVNFQHDRSRNIGFITGTALSSFPDSQLITAEQALSRNEPFCLAVSGVLWKIVDDGGVSDYVEYLDQSGDEMLEPLSLSWELSFTDFVIAVGTKNIYKARIIDDEAGIETYSKYLREEGGTGWTPDNEEVYMVVSGNPVLRAMGVVRNPAGNVRGIVTGPRPESQASTDDVKALTEKITALQSQVIELQTAASTQSVPDEKKVEKSEKNISQPSKIFVKAHNMKSFKSREDLHQYFTEASAPPETEKAFMEFLEQEIKAGAKTYIAEQEAAKAEAETAAANALAEKAKVEKLEAQVSDLVSQLQEIQAEQVEALKQGLLESRLESLSSQYDMSDEKLKRFVVKQIADLDETAYASWLEETASFFPAKNKPEVSPIVATAAIQETVASTDTLPNSQNITPSTRKYEGLDKVNLFTLKY